MGTEDEFSKKGGTWERRGANAAVWANNGGEVDGDGGGIWLSALLLCQFRRWGKQVFVMGEMSPAHLRKYWTKRS